MMRGVRRAVVCSVAFHALALVSAGAVAAQQRWAPEARVDVIDARTTAVHAALGMNAIGGTYLRIGVLAGGGARRVNDEWIASGRAEIIARFHVDPFAESKWGAYVGGGAAYYVDDGARGRARAVVVIGVEARRRPGQWMPGIELGLGGGARVGITLRRARTFAR